MYIFAWIGFVAGILNLGMMVHLVRRIVRGHKSIDWHDNYLKTLIERNTALEQQVENLTPCPDEFKYVWNGVLEFDESERIQEWLDNQDQTKFKVSIVRLAHMDQCDCIKVSSIDKQFAMLFKLTFGGTA
jgi:hypothetical protein